jgi:hypothetical protein
MQTCEGNIFHKLSYTKNWKYNKGLKHRKIIHLSLIINERTNILIKLVTWVAFFPRPMRKLSGLISLCSNPFECKNSILVSCIQRNFKKKAYFMFGSTYFSLSTDISISVTIWKSLWKQLMAYMKTVWVYFIFLYRHSIYKNTYMIGVYAITRKRCIHHK